MSGEEALDISEEAFKDWPVAFLSEIATTRGEKIRILKQLKEEVERQYGAEIAIKCVREEYPHLLADHGPGRLGYQLDPSEPRKMIAFYRPEGLRTAEDAEAIIRAPSKMSLSDEKLLKRLLESRSV